MALKLLSDVGCSERVISHCKAVSALAVKFARTCESKGITVDTNLVEVGGLLHDIGRSKTHDIDHAVVGVEIAKSLDLPEDVILIIEHHIGGGIGAHEAKMLGLPVKDYFPTTLEEKIVAYADKLLSGSETVPIEHTIDQFSKKLGANHPAVKHVIKLHEEISPLVSELDANNNTP
ncbi:MAG: TIGR00295 family protein [archaeon]|nr:TIGR00295 family protein [Candidatus Bathyarchaeum sp.]